MPRAGTIFGSVKSLFKVSRNGCQKTEQSLPAGMPDATQSAIDSETPTPLSDNYASQASSTVTSSKEGVKMPSVPEARPKALHRKLFSRSFLPARSPMSNSEAAVCHSISDPFENPSTRASPPDASEHASLAQGVRLPTKTPRLNMALREADSSMLSSAATTPAATCDLSRRCMSLDIPAGSLSSPPMLSKSRMLLPVVLASAGNIELIRSPDFVSPSLLCSADVPAFQSPAPAPVAPPTTTLLALSPAVPDVMRRRQWSVEDYEVSRKLYKGATSTVYKATCRRSGLPVALKVYFLSKVPLNVIHMIVREIKIHVDLVHKHIVMLYAAFQDEKRLVLVQEYAGRGDLYGIYRSLNRRMTEAQLVHLVLAPFMEALSYLHGRGVCHRDIKPENILFTSDWRLVMADFGVSIDMHRERAVTRAGTLEYMAPEVERCPLKMLPEENKDNLDLAYTTAVDIWAVGVLAYELLVGFAPFVGDRPPPPPATTGTDAGAAGRAANMTSKVLGFPSSTSVHAREFIRLALSERPEERPTARQLLQHPWLAAAQVGGRW